MRAPARRFLAWVWDNPTAEHDARLMLNSFKVGAYLGVLGLAILFVTGLVFFVLPEEDRTARSILATSGSAPYLIAAALFVVVCFVTMMVPLRAVGLLEGPRWRGYLDQLVSTGVSPLRYFAGKWATCQPFFAALLGVSLPFVLVFGLLGGADWGWVLLSYLFIYIYCNVLLLVTFALGTLLHEALAVVLTWVVFGASIFMALTPVPSTVASLTPVRYLIQPLVESLAGASPVVAAMYGPARLFGLELPWPVFALLLWGTLMGLCLITCLTGPLHAFSPGLNNFGAVVLTGDKKRMFFRRFRPLLNRRVELAFLFENSSPRVLRWSLLLRSLQQLVFLGGLAALWMGLVLEPQLVRIEPLQAVYISYLITLGVLLVAALVTLSCGRAQSTRRLEVGALSLPVGVLDAGVFVLFLGWLVVLHLVGFSAVWEDLNAARMINLQYERFHGPTELFTHTSSVAAVLLATAASTFLVIKLVGTTVLGKMATLGGGVVYLFLIFVLPLILLGLSQAFAMADLPELERAAGPMFLLAQASPATQIQVIDEGVPRGIAPGSWLLDHGFWLWHPLLIAYLTTLVVLSQRALVRESQVRLQGVETTGHEPCARCESQLALPVPWTWWGGVWVPRKLGTMRCLGCRETFEAGLGTPNSRVRSLIFMGRVIVYFGAALAFAFLAVS